jgi:hypothetical protein
MFCVEISPGRRQTPVSKGFRQWLKVKTKTKMTFHRKFPQTKFIRLIRAQSSKVGISELETVLPTHPKFRTSVRIFRIGFGWLRNPKFSSFLSEIWRFFMFII